jgi:hypothetical protein
MRNICVQTLILIKVELACRAVRQVFNVLERTLVIRNTNGLIIEKHAHRQMIRKQKPNTVLARVVNPFLNED